MKLTDCLSVIGPYVRHRALEGQDHSLILGLAIDSRLVKPGFIFIGLPGTHEHGARFAPQADKAGASIMITDLEGYDLCHNSPEIQAKTLIVPQPLEAVAHLAQAFYGPSPSTIVAVTGTNGKSSTVRFCQQIWQQLGYLSSSIGTLGIQWSGVKIADPILDHKALTTPDPLSLHHILAALAKGGITHAAMEASSHGIDQGRLTGIMPKAAAFTNLSRDHLDYHADEESYFAVKKRLFQHILPPQGVAVLNKDSDRYKDLLATCRQRQQSVLSYGLSEGELYYPAIKHRPDGFEVILSVLGRQYELVIPLVGSFQLSNILCALGLVLGSASSKEVPVILDRLGDIIRRLQPIPGRLEYVGQTPEGGRIYVDYAHTPDALAVVLKALRQHTAKKLHVVFGCGGDRDQGKRPLMGDVASCEADQIIITDDNPRHEDPALIRAAIKQACPKGKEIAGRKEALAKALHSLKDGDILLVAGKGHETEQTIGDQAVPFHDPTIIRSLLNQMG